MNLHSNPQLFKDAITFASRPIEDGGLGISPLFIEKDYWICRSLRLMTLGDPDCHAIFKGGTSLSKAYGIGARFSEDIDVAISEAWKLNGNQLKNLIKRTAHNMTDGLEEVVIPAKTSKGSHYHKAFYRYPQVVDTAAVPAINPGQILVEINAFANPYPFERLSIQSFLTTFLIASNNEGLVEEYDMQPFVVPVLDKRRTLTEKLASLVRCSLADEYLQQLNAKIRHFYDLHYLLRDSGIHSYLTTVDFKNDFQNLFAHDQQRFSQPKGWQNRSLGESPLFTSLDDVWRKLEPTYLKELPGLAYQQIPSSSSIIESVSTILKHIQS